MEPSANEATHPWAQAGALADRIVVSGINANQLSLTGIRRAIGIGRQLFSTKRWLSHRLEALTQLYAQFVLEALEAGDKKRLKALLEDVPTQKIIISAAALP